MRHFHYYHAQTGVLHTDAIAVNGPDEERVAAANCPPGHLPVEGHFDRTRHRIDTDTRRRVPYTPPAPSTAETRAQVRADALYQIQQLEAAQPRAVRDAVLTGDRSRLQAIEDKISALRSVITEQPSELVPAPGTRPQDH